ncbi:MAG: hypothetical protein WKG07_43170 [Hymenobacter sp.]
MTCAPNCAPAWRPSFPACRSSLRSEEYLRSGPAADVLTVATPNGLHAPQAVAGLRARPARGN